MRNSEFFKIENSVCEKNLKKAKNKFEHTFEYFAYGHIFKVRQNLGKNKSNKEF